MLFSNYTQHGFMAKQYGFGRQHRLSRDKEIIHVLSTGKAVDAPHFKLKFADNTIGNIRICISMNKKIGSAPLRNRAKRLFREIFRLNKEKIKDGVDLMVIGKDEVGKESLNSLREEFFSALKKGNLLKG